MGKILDRIRGKSLQNNQNEGIIGRFRKSRTSEGGGMFGGSIQQTIVDLRNSIHDTINEAAPEDGVIRKGAVSNILPNLRSIRLIPAPEEPAPTTGLNVPTPNPSGNLQIQPPDVPLLNKQNKMQYNPEDVPILGGQYQINIA